LSTTPGNLEFNGPAENFCVKCSTALVSGHKTGYQIAYLRNWSPYFIFAAAPCCIKCISCFVLYLGKVQGEQIWYIT